MSKRRPDARKTGRRAAADPGLGSPRPSARYRVGRLLQFVGLLILPFGIASELVGRVGLGQSLLVAAGGALAFYAGYVVQHGGNEAI